MMADGKRKSGVICSEVQWWKQGGDEIVDWRVIWLDRCILDWERLKQEFWYALW